MPSVDHLYADELRSIGGKLWRATGSPAGPFVPRPTRSIELKLSPREIVALQFALVEARNSSLLTDELNEFRGSQAEAMRRLAEPRTPASYRAVAELLGVSVPKSKYAPFRFPIDLIGAAFDVLTNADGRVTIGNERAFWLDPDDGLFEVDNCPLSPENALIELKEMFGCWSVPALRKALQRRRRQIAALSESERAATGPRGLKLPQLSKLPSGPAYEKK